MLEALTWRRVYLVITATILLAPAIAMQFTDEVSWGAGDFAAAAVLLAGAWIALEAASRLSPDRAQRVAASALVGVALLAIWAYLSVGILD